MKYYVMNQKLGTGSWVLGNIRHIDNWLLLNPSTEEMEPGIYQIELDFTGEKADFVLAGYAGIPVLSEKLYHCLKELPDFYGIHSSSLLQLAEIIPNDPKDKFYLLLTNALLDCVNESASIFERYTQNDEIRPDLSGMYKIFTRLVIDSNKTQNKHIFRLAEYPTALFCSETVRNLCVQHDAVGVEFRPVNGENTNIP